MKNQNLAIKRLIKEYDKLKENPLESIFALPDPKNIFLWHFVIFNLNNDSYKDGIYHGKIFFPVDYPMKPPSLIFITPNGRFEVNIKICLSFTSYHPEHWSASWTIENMLIGLVSFMNSLDKTTGSIETSNSKKQELAKNSLDFNLKNKEFVEIFQNYFNQLKISNEKINQKSNEPQQYCFDSSSIVAQDFSLSMKILLLIIVIFILSIAYHLVKAIFNLY